MSQGSETGSHCNSKNKLSEKAVNFTIFFINGKLLEKLEKQNVKKKIFKLITIPAMALSLSLSATAYAEPPAETVTPETVVESAAETAPAVEMIASETIAETIAETIPEAESTDEIQVIETVPETETPTISDFETEEITEESEEDDIKYVSDDRLDENGNVTIEVEFPEDAVFPYNITLNGPNGDVNFEITYNGQQLLIKPGTYTVKSVKNGNNKKLDKGASISITENTDIIYLDFTNPDKDNAISALSILITNAWFLIIAALGFAGFKAYCRYAGIKKGD